MTAAPEPTRLLIALRAVAAVLDERDLPWALVGGLAVSVRAQPRFTRDIDVAVAVADDAGAEALVRDLIGAGFALELSLEQRALGRLAAVRVRPPDEPAEGIVIDLLFASSGIEPDICREADRLEVASGLIVPVAQAGHLVAMKILAIAPDRPQDGVDLRVLIAALSEAERARARQAVHDIAAAGATRGKPIQADLERWLEA